MFLYLKLFFGIFFFTVLLFAGEKNNKDLQLELKDIIYTLSSEDFNGRRAGTNGESKAAEYLQRKLLELDNVQALKGFHNNFIVPFSFYNPSFNKRESFVNIDGFELVAGTDYLPIVTSASGEFTLSEVQLLYPTENFFVEDLSNLAGKAVLLFESDWNCFIKSGKKNIFEIIKKIEESNARGIILVSSNENVGTYFTLWHDFFEKKKITDKKDLERLLISERSKYFKSMHKLTIPAVYMSKNAYKNYWLKYKEKNVFLKGELKLKLDIKEDYFKGKNVVVYLPGLTEDNILLSAHYDSLGQLGEAYVPGADDNASGVAANLLIFKKLSENYNKKIFKRGCILVFYSGEEWGLLGSMSFMEQLKEHGLLKTIKASINLDSISYGSTNSFFILGELPNPDLVNYISNFVGTTSDISFNKNIEFAFKRGSDHYSAHLSGIPAVDITTGRPSYMHTIEDTPDKVNFQKLAVLTDYLFLPVISLLNTNFVSFEIPKKKYAPYPGNKILYHNIEVDLQPGRSLAVVQDVLGYNQKPKNIKLSAHTKELRLSWNNRGIGYSVQNLDDASSIVIQPEYPVIPGALKLNYILDASDGETGEGDDHFSSSDPGVIINEDGIYLSPAAYWYPEAQYKYEKVDLRVKIPEGWSSVSGGSLLYHKTIEGKVFDKWVVDYPSERIHLIAGKYKVYREFYRGIFLETFFHPELIPFQQSYIEKLKYYYDLYTELLGTYPYDRFSVVSNFFSTGYGMAGYTLLDKNIIPLPFIPTTSLGHEFLHNWWGNSLYVDYEQGNWCEGLTVYQADYLYETIAGVEKARAYRLTLLRNYQNFVTPDQAFPLKEFINRTSPASRAIGYGKAMMVFHMLKRQLGEVTFNQALRNLILRKSYEYISYDDLQEEFQKHTTIDLERYFRQWVDRKDIPKLRLTYSIYDSEVNVNIIQENENPYFLEVPIRFIYEDGTFEDKIVQLDKQSISQMFKSGKKLEKVELDPDYHLMRVLLYEENPPSLNMLFGRADRFFYSLSNIDIEIKRAFEKEIRALPLANGNEELFIMENLELGELSKASVIFMQASSFEGNFVKNLLQLRDELEYKHGMLYFRGEEPREINPYENVLVLSFELNGKPVILCSFPDLNFQSNLFARLKHYGKYSYLAFTRDGEKLFSGVWEN